MDTTKSSSQMYNYWKYWVSILLLDQNLYVWLVWFYGA